MNNVSSPAFRGVYKLNVPNVQTLKDEKEKEAIAETMVNALVMGANLSIAEPRIANDNSAVYFKIDNKNDSTFETGFNTIIKECNKQFNMDLAKKVYINKVNDNEFNNANVIQ